jgi:hypothetical protein
MEESEEERKDWKSETTGHKYYSFPFAHGTLTSCFDIEYHKDSLEMTKYIPIITSRHHYRKRNSTCISKCTSL